MGMGLNNNMGMMNSGYGNDYNFNLGNNNPGNVYQFTNNNQYQQTGIGVRNRNNDIDRNSQLVNILNYIIYYYILILFIFTFFYFRYWILLRIFMLEEVDVIRMIYMKDLDK